jgi:hypothetical protein
MKSKYAMWAFYLSCFGLILTLVVHGKFDGVAFLFSALSIVSIFVYNYFEVKAINEERKQLKEYFELFEQTGISPEVDDQTPLCSTCHKSMNTPGCSTSSESKIKYPNGFHTLGGGCSSQEIQPL